MKDTRLARIKIVFIIIATLVVLCYVYFVAPFFVSDISELREENKKIEHDLSQIKAIGSDTSTIEENIELAEDELARYAKRADMDSDSFDMLISYTADKTKVKITEMTVENSEAVEVSNDNDRTLYRQPVVINIDGDFDNGIKFINGLEKNEDGLFNIKDFLYSIDEKDKNKKTWMISVDAYYYEKNL